MFSKFFSFRSAPQTAVGLSIGTSSIKIVELRKDLKIWNLVHFGFVQLPENVVVNREIVNAVAITDSIKKLIDQIHLKNKSVCFSLSGDFVMVKKIKLEITDLKDLEDQVYWEAEQYLPFDISEVTLDYEVLCKSKNNQSDIMIVAVKKSVLEIYMDCIFKSGLTPKIVDIDFFALQNIFESVYSSSPELPSLVIDIGAASMKAVVVENGVPIFIKDSKIGGNHLTAKIQNQLNLSYFDAEILKITGGEKGAFPKEVSDLIEIGSQSICLEIKKIMDSYYASSSGPLVSGVLLAGGGSRLMGLSKAVEKTLNLPVQTMNPFNFISYDPAVFTDDYITNISSIASVPIGLALRAGMT